MLYQRLKCSRVNISISRGTEHNRRKVNAKPDYDNCCESFTLDLHEIITAVFPV